MSTFWSYFARSAASRSACADRRGTEQNEGQQNSKTPASERIDLLLSIKTKDRLPGTQFTSGVHPTGSGKLEHARVISRNAFEKIGTSTCRSPGRGRGVKGGRGEGASPQKPRIGCQFWCQSGLRLGADQRRSVRYQNEQKHRQLWVLRRSAASGPERTTAFLPDSAGIADSADYCRSRIKGVQISTRVISTYSAELQVQLFESQRFDRI